MIAIIDKLSIWNVDFTGVRDYRLPSERHLAKGYVPSTEIVTLREQKKTITVKFSLDQNNKQILIPTVLLTVSLISTSSLHDHYKNNVQEHCNTTIVNKVLSCQSAINNEN